jgi:hypothetical protein
VTRSRYRAPVAGLVAAAVTLACVPWLAAQSPKGPPLVPGNTWQTGLSPGEVKRVYDGGLDRTEVWLEIVPAAEGAHPNPTTLYFAVVYPGRVLQATPERVWIRAQSDLTQQPRRLRSATLALSVDGAMLVNVVNPKDDDEASRHFPCGPGGDCAFDGIVAPMSTMDFYRLLQGKRVFGEALGFPFTLGPEQVDRLAAFARELVPARR